MTAVSATGSAVSATESAVSAMESAVSATAAMLICNLWICISNDILRLMIKYKSIVELNVKQINHIIKKRFLYTLGKSG